jgi:hypothetical protein
MKTLAIKVSLRIVGIVALMLLVGPTALLYLNFGTLNSNSQATATNACIPLPKGFEESELVGTWVGNYFGNIDKLVIRADGRYKQIYSDGALNTLSFTSDWQRWHIEYDSAGHARLHLDRLRRCDGTDAECNTPGGGLPAGSVAIDPCKPEYVNEVGEVVLFVTGQSGTVPRGLVLLQARLAGSDWNWSYQLQQ